MRFLFISRYGDILPTALRVRDEGNEVIVYIDSEAHRSMYDGIIDRAPSMTTRQADWADIVIFDHVGLGPTADRIAKRKPVIGGGSLQDGLEMDRDFAFKSMEKYGINYPSYRQFSSKELEKAIKFVESLGAPMVFKAVGEFPTFSTYVSDGPGDLIPMTKYLMVNLPDLKEFILQDFVRGVELSTEGWFAGDHWLEPFNVTFEDKKLLAGNLGPNTGCAGNLVKAVSPMPRSAREGLKPLTDLLARANYVGPLDINAIISEGGFHALEFTPRFGYDAWQAMTMLLTKPIGKFFEELANGTKEFPADTTKWAAGVRLTIPRDDQGKPTPDVPLPGIDLQRNIHFSDVKMTDGKLYSAGADNNLLTAVAAHTSKAAALGEVYDLLRSLKTPNAEYRTDVGERVSDDLASLKYWGYEIT